MSTAQASALVVFAAFVVGLLVFIFYMMGDWFARRRPQGEVVIHTCFPDRFEVGQTLRGVYADFEVTSIVKVEDLDDDVWKVHTKVIKS